jgi:hypothetical protein
MIMDAKRAARLAEVQADTAKVLHRTRAITLREDRNDRVLATFNGMGVVIEGQSSFWVSTSEVILGAEE